MGGTRRHKIVNKGTAIYSREDEEIASNKQTNKIEKKTAKKAKREKRKRFQATLKRVFD